MREDKEKQKTFNEEPKKDKEQGLSETWAQDGLQDLEDWIEEQGIYIRQ